MSSLKEAPYSAFSISTNSPITNLSFRFASSILLVLPLRTEFSLNHIKDGFDKAKQAANLLKEAGHKAWIWDHSKTVGALVWREIANCIVNQSDAVLYICTSSSLQSWGQGQETS